jgi:2-octaprenyl-6-methoxyphenol hydroxylase
MSALQTNDIAIVGGGLVGLCAALAMQHPARRVRIIEAAPPGKPRPGGLNGRSIALSTSSVQVFRALGVWPRLSAEAAPIRQIQISSRGHWGVTRLRAADYDLEALGYVVENNVLAGALLGAVEASERITLEQGARFEAITQQQRVSIEYRAQKRKKSLDARLALIADGADSAARAALGIGHRRIDYGQSAVVVNVEVGKPLADIAYERFTTGGPLAMLPLGGRRYACVWTCSPSRAGELADLSEAEFAAALQAVFGFRLGPIERVGERVAIELRRTRAEGLHAGRCLLIGNAANALHPVAGQSFNMSLRDIACLHELLADRELADLDDEDWCALAGDYERRRETEHRRVIGYGDGLVTLFSNPLPVFDRLRAGGLAALDLLPALKAQAAFAGMGLTFGGNRLLRGHL